MCKQNFRFFEKSHYHYRFSLQKRKRNMQKEDIFSLENAYYVFPSGDQNVNDSDFFKKSKILLTH